MFVLMAYDVVEGRTEMFRKLLCRYLIGRQNSVFSGNLPLSKLTELRGKLGEITIPGDRLMELKAENRRNVDLAFLSKSEGNGTLARSTDDGHKSDMVVL